MTRTGLPHSEIRGSRPICGSPRLFAADRVLLRLLTPRHPPYAFRSLTFPRFLSCVSPQGIISDVLGLVCDPKMFGKSCFVIAHKLDDFLSFCLLCSFQGTTLRELCSLKTRQCRKRSTSANRASPFGSRSWDVFAYDLLPNRLRLLDKSADAST